MENQFNKPIARVRRASEISTSQIGELGACHQECKDPSKAGGSPKCLKTMSLYRISRKGVRKVSKDKRGASNHRQNARFDQNNTSKQLIEV